MGNYLLKRLLLIIPTLIGVSILVFLLMRVIPGDPAQQMLYPKGTPEEVAALRVKLGLNKPLLYQYEDWIGNAVRLNFGTSVQTGDSVSDEIFSRIPATLELTLSGLFIAVLIGIPIGVLASWRKNTIVDYLCNVVSLGGVSIPVFWLGLMLIFLFAVVFHLLPVSGRISMGTSFEQITGFYILDSVLTGNFAALGDALRHLILPAFTLATIPLAQIVRVTRSSLLEVLAQDYMMTAKAKGIPFRLYICKHALKNAFIPVVTVIGLQIGASLGGAILTEAVFSWPGIGSLIVTAIGNRDYPVIQGVVLILTLFMVLVNVLVDIVYAYVDPRIKY